MIFKCKKRDQNLKQVTYGLKQKYKTKDMNTYGRNQKMKTSVQHFKTDRNPLTSKHKTQYFHYNNKCKWEIRL